MAFDELPEHRHREPQRSRLQMDMSPHTRKTIQAYAKTLKTNQKRLILEAVAKEHPQLADELLSEIKRDAYVTNNEVRQRDDK